MKAICLVVIRQGVANTYAPQHVNVQIVDLDNIEAGDGPVELPEGMGFEVLVKEANLEENTDYRWTN